LEVFSIRNISKWHHVVSCGLSIFKRLPMQTIILICIKQQNFSSAIPVTMLIDAKDIFFSVQKKRNRFLTEAVVFSYLYIYIYIYIMWLFVFQVFQISLRTAKYVCEDSLPRKHSGSNTSFIYRFWPLKQRNTKQWAGQYPLFTYCLICFPQSTYYTKHILVP
jgi:hypothetical protein